MIKDNHVNAFNKVREIHSRKEIIEIHSHAAYEWADRFYCLNELTINQIMDLLEKSEADK